jgi:hypothetical protein
MLSADASATEAAAVVAAVERFIADTAPVAHARPSRSAWQAAALHDGIAARQVGGGGWGESRWSKA